MFAHETNNTVSFLPANLQVLCRNEPRSRLSDGSWSRLTSPPIPDGADGDAEPSGWAAKHCPDGGWAHTPPSGVLGSLSRGEPIFPQSCSKVKDAVMISCGLDVFLLLFRATGELPCCMLGAANLTAESPKVELHQKNLCHPT